MEWLSARCIIYTDASTPVGLCASCHSQQHPHALQEFSLIGDVKKRLPWRQTSLNTSGPNLSLKKNYIQTETFPKKWIQNPDWNLETSGEYDLLWGHLCVVTKPSGLKLYVYIGWVWQEISRQTDLPTKQTREICAISLHTPTASSRLHYLDYSESAVHLKALTSSAALQDRTHSCVAVRAVRWWGIIICCVEKCTR